MSICTILILLFYLEVHYGTGHVTDVTWMNRESLNGYTFNGNKSFTLSTITRSACAQSCWNIPLCISFTSDGAICTGYTQSFDSLFDYVENMNTFYFVAESVKGYTDCSDVQHTRSGIYRVFPIGIKEGLEVYCDMETDSGGWTVVQRRQDGSVNFYRTLQEYSDGFGDLAGEFYLGNKYIHIVTNQADYELRIDLRNASDQRRYAKYSSFRLDSESTNYTLHVSGYDSNSNAGDSLTTENQNQFKAKDSVGQNWCATARKGAWWYGYCSHANLNGLYLTPGTRDARGIRWDTFEDVVSLKYVDMKIRRK